MFNIGFTELLILGVLGLLIIGPEQLPELAKKLARVLTDLKRAKDEIMSPVNEFKNEAEQFVTKARTNLQKNIMPGPEETKSHQTTEDPHKPHEE